jgi:intracellular sulfur oxidation DsrE/DsrF family protein
METIVKSRNPTRHVAILAIVGLILLGLAAALRLLHSSNDDGTDLSSINQNTRPRKAEVPAEIAAKFEFPVIAGYGGVVQTPGAAEGPRKGSKVVFDVTADAKDPDKVVPALERIAMLLNLGGQAGLKPADFRITVVLHGNATAAALSDAAYQKSEGRANPNADLMAKLKAAGVEMFVCGQALARKGFGPKDVRGEFRIAVAALTFVVNKQADGFAYVPAH